MLEKEIKALIDKQDFEDLKIYLLAKCKEHKSFLQINYYYDNEDYYLHEHRNTLRVRQIEDKLKLEYKCKKAMIMDGVHTSHEYSKSIVAIPLLVNVSDEFGIKDNNFYKCIGNLITQRSNYYIKDTIVSLDKNYYLGKIDYELEIEGENLEEIQKVYNQLEIPSSSLFYPGKFGRYCEIAKKLIVM